MAEDSRDRRTQERGQIEGTGGVQVSVIMPCYNAEGTIRKALDSALSQEDVTLEVIAVNDCSTDRTGEILAEYARDGRVTVLTNTASLGAGGSRNRAVAHARGKYVAFLDSDDAWAEGKLKKQVDMLESHHSVLCCTGRELMTPEGILTGRIIHVGSRITYAQLLKHNSINCSSVMLPRNVALHYPMEHEDSHEDYITWLKILGSLGPAVGIDEPLLQYRLSATGKSGSKFRSAAMTFKVYRYMGFSLPKSLCCFTSYALHGVWKYLRSYINPEG